MHMDNLTF